MIEDPFKSCEINEDNFTFHFWDTYLTITIAKKKKIAMGLSEVNIYLFENGQ